jgi:hypothetical protein
MSRIDREALVRRHNPVSRSWNPQAPLSVGNGDFAFTADFTGLQTCGDHPAGSIPLCTMSQWGLHSYPDAPENDNDLRLKEYQCVGRTVGYMSDSEGQEELYNGLRVNPHRFHLGKIGLYFDSVTDHPDSPGGPSSEDLLESHITEVEQTLDLWTGQLHSRFHHDGQSVSVETVCHPDKDMIAVRIESPLLAEGEIGLDLRFPYASHKMEGSDWSKNSLHSSTLNSRSTSSYLIERIMDNSRYSVSLDFSPEGNVQPVQKADHHWVFTTDRTVMEFTICFSPVSPGAGVLKGSEDFQDTADASALWWNRFWFVGAAVSFEGSRDKRAVELERRIILSQYLLAIQSLGSLPPAETGLTCNSWYGKFHLEMHVWHALHGLLWNRASLVEQSLSWYEDILPVARKRAEQQGYNGVRWPKMTDPSGKDSPSQIGTLLCWQQPHMILFAELLYRLNPTEKLLSDYGERVFETAAFMADYAIWDEDTGRYVLGPPLIPAQENHDPEETLNPCFELEYWRWGLKTAIEWKTRLGEAVLAGLSSCPLDGKHQRYAAHERCSDSFGRYGTDHPSMLLAYGFLPLQTVDPQIMSNSYDAVIDHWQMETMWGWDFPSMAMTLARLGRRKEAVDALLMDGPKNLYLFNGHNRQEGHDALPLYLPGNGALLLATAMMAGGWDGSEGHAPGFPDDGSWTVACEGFAPYL